MLLPHDRNYLKQISNQKLTQYTQTLAKGTKHGFILSPGQQ